MSLILTDIDDTVLTWYDEFRIWLNNSQGIEAPANPHFWKLGKTLSMSEDAADQLVHEFNASNEFLQNQSLQHQLQNV